MKPARSFCGVLLPQDRPALEACSAASPSSSALRAPNRTGSVRHLQSQSFISSSGTNRCQRASLNRQQSDKSSCPRSHHKRVSTVSTRYRVRAHTAQVQPTLSRCSSRRPWDFSSPDYPSIVTLCVLVRPYAPLSCFAASRSSRLQLCQTLAVDQG